MVNGPNKTPKTDDLNPLADAHLLVQQARVLAKHGTSVERGIRTKVRWEGRAQQAYEGLLGNGISDTEVDGFIAAAQLDWSNYRKAGLRDLVVHFKHLAARLQAYFGHTDANGLAVYMSLSQDLSEDSGQHTLDNLGINETWRWTNPREMARDQFAVRGSKVIAGMYENHITALQRMIIRATDPAKPQSVKEVRREIQEQWPKITKADAERVARSETAAVWETTNFNVQRANGVEMFDWAIAHGPSIGGGKSYPVCKYCLKAAAGGPYPFDSCPIPPRHPNCRCTLIPSLAHDWLPPAETWTGGPNPPLPLIQAPNPTPET